MHFLCLEECSAETFANCSLVAKVNFGTQQSDQSVTKAASASVHFCTDFVQIFEEQDCTDFVQIIKGISAHIFCTEFCTY